MTNRIKEKYGHRLNYNIRLNQGKIFKANTELRSLLTKKQITESTTYEEEDEQIQILNKIDKKINIKKVLLTQLNQEKNELQEEKRQFDQCEMDEEFEEQMTEKIQQKEERKIIKSARIQAINSENKSISKDYYNRTVQTSRKDRWKNKNMERDYNYFIEKGSTLPKPYVRKLKNMTNNNGYLWKRIYFYGERPIAEGDNTRTIYELFRDKMIVHYRNNNGEWTHTTRYKEKKTNNNKSNNYVKYSKNHNYSFKRF